MRGKGRCAHSGGEGAGGPCGPILSGRGLVPPESWGAQSVGGPGASQKPHIHPYTFLPQLSAPPAQHATTLRGNKTARS